MGWWETGSGEIVGDGPLDILDTYAESGMWLGPGDVPPYVRGRIDQEYTNGLGRVATDAEIVATLAFNRT